jgi:DNA segregation ATPase FtsK/SpoIIIE, S-DNA-T family
MMRPDAAKLFRIQGCFVADDEIGRIVSFWKAHAAEQGNEHHMTVAPWTGLLDHLDDEDELFLDAIDIVRGLTTCSTSLLQRKLHVGYPKAAQLMDQLAAKGFVGPDLGGGQGRVVLLKSEEVGEPSDEE